MGVGAPKARPHRAVARSTLKPKRHPKRGCFLFRRPPKHLLCARCLAPCMQATETHCHIQRRREPSSSSRVINQIGSELQTRSKYPPLWSRSVILEGALSKSNTRLMCVLVLHQCTLLPGSAPPTASVSSISVRASIVVVVPWASFHSIETAGLMVGVGPVSAHWVSVLFVCGHLGSGRALGDGREGGCEWWREQ